MKSVRRVPLQRALPSCFLLNRPEEPDESVAASGSSTRYEFALDLAFDGGYDNLHTALAEKKLQFQA